LRDHDLRRRGHGEADAPARPRGPQPDPPLRGAQREDARARPSRHRSRDRPRAALRAGARGGRDAARHRRSLPVLHGRAFRGDEHRERALRRGALAPDPRAGFRDPRRGAEGAHTRGDQGIRGRGRAARRHDARASQSGVKTAREDELHALESRLGYRFSDLELLDRALTHSSRANEDPSGRSRHNEPLEFLRDAGSGLVVAELLHRRDPEGTEGSKSRARAQLVSAASLARRAEELGLPDLIVLGRGEEKTGGRMKAALWADAYEALLAALYLDGGYEAAHRFVRAEFAHDL